MALKKDIQLENGIVINYHRIVNLSLATNNYMSILVASYVNEENRKKDFLDDKIITSKTYVIDSYNENFNIVKAYDYLKTLPKFNGAINI